MEGVYIDETICTRVHYMYSLIDLCMNSYVIHFCSIYASLVVRGYGLGRGKDVSNKERATDFFQ